MRTAMFLVVLCCTTFSYGQQYTKISGIVKDGISRKPISNVSLQVQGIGKEFRTDADGIFSIEIQTEGSHLLQILAPDFIPKRFEIRCNGELLDLGEIFLDKDIVKEEKDNIITLSENDLSDDDGLISSSMGLLQSTRDVFLNRAAFDFGQAFFKVKGYDSRNGEVLINGIPMNKFWDGRPQWNNWGGLNDVVRNQEFSNTLELNPYTFGGILGNTNIDTRPSGFRPGLRISSSASNRTYRGRVMTTYSSSLLKSGLSYSISSSRRWANSGYVDGTLYDAYSFFGSLEYQLNTKNSLALTAIMAKNRRGRSAALTEEIFDLLGNQYNPHWGEQNKEVRNSRERMIFEPLFILNHFMQSKKLNWTSGIAYQNGITAKSRLGYYNAANPDPTYYKYVPSYHANSSIGADFTNMGLAKEGFLTHSQIAWDKLYYANANTVDNEAAYMLYEDMVQEIQLMLSSSLNFKVSEHLKIGMGTNFRDLTSQNYAEIKDLLGADFHTDVDTFSNTANDIEESAIKTVGEKVGYNFELHTTQMSGFGQIEFQGNGWNGFMAALGSNLKVQRMGLFKNERFPENSKGTSKELSFNSTALKSGITFFLSGRHSVSANTSLIYRPPVLQNVFINPRENNFIVPEIQREQITAIDLNYFIRLPDITGRLSAFYTRFQNTTDINFFFTDSGLGSDFVQEVITGLDRLHKGLELGVEYQVSNDVKLSVVGNLGNYTYASDPEVQLYFDTAGSADELINKEGNADLGIAKVKGLRLAQGPQTALALGAEYRSPRYWWMGATTNYLDQSYISTSTIIHTQSFLLNPDTGARFLDATDENVAEMRKQEKLKEIYLLNLIGGKSWLVDKKYISAFLSVNNLFDSVFKTGVMSKVGTGILSKNNKII